jgi:tetratricopeptide (TPR) repeat protein
MCRHLLYALFPAVLAVACGGAKPTASGDTRPSGEPSMAAQDKRAETMRLYMEATHARLRGENERAIQLYHQCLKADPQNAAAMFELGKLYHQTMRTAQALEMARRAVNTDRDNIWYRFLLADLLRESGRPGEAAEVYRETIARWPGRYEVHLDLAHALVLAGKHSEAAKVYADMESRFGLNEDLVVQQFHVLMNAGRGAEAEQLVQRAIAAFPRTPAYLSMLAELYDQRGEHDKALGLYQRAVALDPDNSMLRMSLAEHHYTAGRHDEAFAELGRVFEDPDVDIDAKMQVLLGFFEMTRFEGERPNDRPDLIRRSYELIDILERTHPESGKPNAIRGDFLMRDGRIAEARDQFRHALRHERARFPIWQQVLQLDLQLNDFASLHADAAEAITVFPLVPELHLYDGIALSRLGRHQEAIEALVAGRDLVVDNPALQAQFWSSLGDAYHESKDFARSDEAFERALALQPNDPTVLNNHAYYLSVRNVQLEKAERMSRRSNELAPGQASFQDTYAWILFRLGRYAEARTWIEKALASGGSSEGVIVEHFGDILFKLGDAAGALEQWRRAKTLGGASDSLDRKINEGRWLE